MIVFECEVCKIGRGFYRENDLVKYALENVM